jgi:hypothetical protein
MKAIGHDADHDEGLLSGSPGRRYRSAPSTRPQRMTEHHDGRPSQLVRPREFTAERRLDAEHAEKPRGHALLLTYAVSSRLSG